MFANDLSTGVVVKNTIGPPRAGRKRKTIIQKYVELLHQVARSLQRFLRLFCSFGHISKTNKHIRTWASEDFTNANGSSRLAFDQLTYIDIFGSQPLPKPLQFSILYTWPYLWF